MKDPLQQIDGVALFNMVVKQCEGAPFDVVFSVAVSLLFNCIRQHIALRKDAETILTELHNRLMGLLDDHYDSVTGQRRTFVPYTQTINVPHLEKEHGLLK